MSTLSPVGVDEYVDTTVIAIEEHWTTPALAAALE